MGRNGLGRDAHGRACRGHGPAQPAAGAEPGASLAPWGRAGLGKAVSRPRAAAGGAGTTAGTRVLGARAVSFAQALLALINLSPALTQSKKGCAAIKYSWGVRAPSLAAWRRSIFCLAPSGHGDRPEKEGTEGADVALPGTGVAFAGQGLRSAQVAWWAASTPRPCSGPSAPAPWCRGRAVPIPGDLGAVGASGSSAGRGRR